MKIGWAPLGQHGQGRVGAHRAEGLLADVAHRGEDVFEILKGVAEGLLPVQEGVVVGAGDVRGLGQFGKRNEVVGQPLTVGLGGGDGVLQLLVVDDPAGDHVDQEHAARFEAALVNDFLGRDRQDADLGGHDDQVVLGHNVAAGPQAVAVEHGADGLAVGEAHGGGAVPGLHQAGVILVEVLLDPGHRLVIFPGLRHEHHHGVGGAVAGLDEQLNGVVQAGGVAEPLADDGQELGDVARLEDAPLEQRLAGPHPVDVAAEGVDLAVVSDHPVRVGQLPSSGRCWC